MPFENDLDDYDFFHEYAEEEEERKRAEYFEELEEDDLVDLVTDKTMIRKEVYVLSGTDEVQVNLPNDSKNWDIVQMDSGFVLRRRKSLSEQIEKELNITLNNKEEDERDSLPF